MNSDVKCDERLHDQGVGGTTKVSFISLSSIWLFEHLIILNAFASIYVALAILSWRCVMLDTLVCTFYNLNCINMSCPCKCVYVPAT